MKITILHFSPPEKSPSASTKRLKKRIQEMGYEAKLVRKSDCQLDMTDTKRVLYKNKRFPKSDVVIVLPGFNRNYHHHAGIIKQLQHAGQTIVNKYNAVSISKNKVRTLQYLKFYNIPIPKTIVVESNEYLEGALSKLGQYPVIIKCASGCQGKGVMYIPDKQTMTSVMDVLMASEGDQYLIQEYVEEAKGKDIRVFIVGGKIIAAMERIAKPGEFRSNFHLGGSVQVANLSFEEKNVAIKAAKSIGLEIAGVDILRTSEGPKILEVNSFPGLEGITKATGIDVAGAIVKYAVRKAKIANTKQENKTNVIKDKINGMLGIEK